jgi:hypothetical protein
LKIGGTFWLKSELFLTKIRTLNFDCRASRGRAENFSARAGREGKGVGGKRPEGVASRPYGVKIPVPRSRFSAAAEFRILLCKMRRLYLNTTILFLRYQLLS